MLFRSDRGGAGHQDVYGALGVPKPGVHPYLAEIAELLDELHLGPVGLDAVDVDDHEARVLLEHLLGEERRVQRGPVLVLEALIPAIADDDHLAVPDGHGRDDVQRRIRPGLHRAKMG